MPVDQQALSWLRASDLAPGMNLSFLSLPFVGHRKDFRHMDPRTRQNYILLGKLLDQIINYKISMCILDVGRGKLRMWAKLVNIVICDREE